MTDVRVAILGNPSHAGVAWTPETLAGLVQSGFTAIQLNIAWSYRPHDEPLNLEDVFPVEGSPEPLALPGTENAERRQRELRLRASLARDAGLRTIFHFGAPFQGRTGYEGKHLPQCISDPATSKRYVDAVAAFGEANPDIDDLLIYTYDQDAWLCSEFAGCDSCAGVPLHERVPAFLSALSSAWRRVRAGGRIWWEPWELSAGQTLACIPRLDPAMGLMLHGSIAEVVSTIAGDRFVRNAASLAAAHGIPVVGEVFLSSANEEVEPWGRLPVPLVTLRQLRDLERIPGIVGIKEYFGLVPSPFDVNLAAAAAYFADPRVSERDILDSLAEPWGRPWLTEFWSSASLAYELYPWDASWFGRQLGRSQPMHELSAATVRGMQSSASEWDTPAWKSTRGSIFMRLSNDEAHPWLLEDVGLRFAAAAAAMEVAVAGFDAAFTNSGDDSARELLIQRSEAVAFITRTTAYHCHVRETLLARTIRTDPPTRHRLLEELRAVLETDLANQQRELSRGAGSDADAATPLQFAERWVVPERTHIDMITDAITLFDKDPEQFLAAYLLPGHDAASAGQFTLTSS